jgi:hypothetical protein
MPRPIVLPEDVDAGRTALGILALGGGLRSAQPTAKYLAPSG